MKSTCCEDPCPGAIQSKEYIVNIQIYNGEKIVPRININNNNNNNLIITSTFNIYRRLPAQVKCFLLHSWPIGANLT